ncbi:phospholipase A1-IIdelta [Nymphaea colorata]|uniref:Phospholipase A1 n=1 Tax=Nymphaea colorata TaxID=210225 RepID=A0A5K0VR35_9MAGN|nr:phospholipase A1-IIdelta [Nymphaea colorata]
MAAVSEPSWQELQGSKNWEGLLEPLHPQLRTLIIRCGDFCQATYDTFINDQNSKYCGCSRYGKKSFFEKVAMFPTGVQPDYAVHSFLYATAKVDVPDSFIVKSMSREAWSRESNWIGYVAVSTDSAAQAQGRRDVLVAWRGTTRNLEWIDVFNPTQESISGLLHTQEKPGHFYDVLLGKSSPKVMDGWVTIYTSDDSKSPFTKTSARVQLFTFIQEIVEKYQDEELSITLVGHSLGASLAILSGFDIVENGLTRREGRDPIPVAAFVFGSPMVGNKEFCERFEKLPNLKVLHVRNEIDLIPHYPGKALGYQWTGVELMIDTRKSPYLKDSKNPSDWHNLQTMLHVVAGWQGKNQEFKLQLKRSIALVNKSCEFLKDECLVPGSWWVEKNKGMVQDESGEWVMTPLADDDVPTPEY